MWHRAGWWHVSNTHAMLLCCDALTLALISTLEIPSSTSVRSLRLQGKTHGCWSPPLLNLSAPSSQSWQPTSYPPQDNVRDGQGAEVTMPPSCRHETLSRSMIYCMVHAVVEDSPYCCNSRNGIMPLLAQEVSQGARWHHTSGVGVSSSTPARTPYCNHRG
jgi:hypothetical protein